MSDLDTTNQSTKTTSSGKLRKLKKHMSPKKLLGNKSRDSPEGDSVKKKSKKNLLDAQTSTKKTVKKQNSLKNIPDGAENAKPTKVKLSKKHKIGNDISLADEDDLDTSRGSKRSKMSSDNSSDLDTSLTSIKSPKSKEKTKSKGRISNVSIADNSWEAAVERARGQPDGVSVEEEKDEDVEDVEEEKIEEKQEAVKEEKKKKTVKFEKKDRKSFGSKAMKLASKGLKKITGKAAKEEATKKGLKRKFDKTENQDKDDTKKTKLEEMTKKERKKVRQMAHPNYEIAFKSKKIWEELRQHNITKERKSELCKELQKMVKGKAKELAFAHDTARVIQCLYKHGTSEQKSEIFEELKGDIVEIAKSKYASFLIKKIMKYGTKSQRNFVFKSFNGHVRKLVRHTFAAPVLEFTYNEFANSSQRAALMEEFYGPRFALFKSHTYNSLDEIMKEQPHHKEMILSNMKEALAPLVDKNVLNLTIVHHAFLEYMTHANIPMRTEMIETLREHLIHMIHTRDGSRVAMKCIWYGTAKDRKVIIKSFKTHLVKIAKEEYGHMVLLALFDSVDDTKLVQKVVLEELLKSVHEVAFDKFGIKVLLYLLSPRDSLHFHPDIVKVLQQGDDNPISKKDTDVRRRELLEFVSPALVQYVVSHTKELVMSNSHLLLILTILTHVACDPRPAMEAIAKIAAEPFVSGSLENFHIIEHPAGHLTLKRLVKNDVERMKTENQVLFSKVLLDTVPTGALKSWAACNRGCFILVSMLELNNAEITEQIKKELQSVKKSLGKMDFKGAQILLSKLQ